MRRHVRLGFLTTDYADFRRWDFPNIDLGTVGMVGLNLALGRDL